MTSGLVVGFIFLGVVSRLVPHPWNATPVMAIALFGGTHLSKRQSILLPLVIVAVSDFVIGWHDTVPFTWGAFALTGMLGWRLRARPSAGRILMASVAGSGLFFLITNVGVWLVGRLYPMTAAGVLECFVAAVPFFRNSLIGDVIFTAALFGGYALATSPRPARQPVSTK